MKVPAGEKVTISHGKLHVPDHPIIAFIEGDGTGRDIWARLGARARRRGGQGLQAASARSPGPRSTRARRRRRVRQGLPAEPGCPRETLDVIREYLVGDQGPLTTPVGGGIRSLNVALRQMLDLYVCLRPVRWFKGVPSPVKHPRRSTW